MWKFILVPFMLIIFTMEYIHAQESVLFEGVLINDDSVGISDALVVSKDGISCVTDANGRFQIKLKLPTTIEVVHLNHAGRFDVVENKFTTFALVTKTYDLPVANIGYRYNRVDFDRQFVIGTLPQDTLMVLKEKLFLNELSLGKNINRSPITYLYNRYSKDAKRKQAFEAVVALDQRIETLNRWLSYNRLSNILNVSDTSQITCFFLYCSIHPDWAITHTEVEVIREVIRCKETFASNIECLWTDDLYFPH